MMAFGPLPVGTVPMVFERAARADVEFGDRAVAEIHDIHIAPRGVDG